MSNKASFSSLKERFAKTKGGGGQNNYYPFYKIPEDSQAAIRFLADKNEDNPLAFLVEKVYHELTINGEKKTIPCLHSYGEACPICAVSKEYYDAGDKINGKKFYRKKSYVAQALVVDDPMTEGDSAAGQVKLISIGYSLFNIIRNAFESNELDEAPYSYQGGTNFLIKRTKKGEFSNYDLSKFARRSTDLTEDQIEYVDSQIIDLSTLLPKKPDLEKVETMLESALTGKRFAEDEEEDGDDASSFGKFKKNKPAASDSDEDAAPVRTPASKRATLDEDEVPAPKAKRQAVTEGDEDDEAAVLLQQLQAKRAATRARADSSED